MSGIVAVLPAGGEWVAEKRHGARRVVLPLAGWAVDADGGLRPLPLDLDGTWTIRPRVDADRAAIAASARAIAAPAGPYTPAEVDDETGWAGPC